MSCIDSCVIGIITNLRFNYKEKNVFIKILNSKSPNTHPCGMPTFISFHVLDALFINRILNLLLINTRPENIIETFNEH